MFRTCIVIGLCVIVAMVVVLLWCISTSFLKDRIEQYNSMYVSDVLDFSFPSHIDIAIDTTENKLRPGRYVVMLRWEYDRKIANELLAKPKHLGVKMEAHAVLKENPYNGEGTVFDRQVINWSFHSMQHPSVQSDRISLGMIELYEYEDIVIGLDTEEPTILSPENKPQLYLTGNYDPKAIIIDQVLYDYRYWPIIIGLVAIIGVASSMCNPPRP